jgi:hypothetical protein
MRKRQETDPSIAFEFDFSEDAPEVLWRIVSLPAGSPSTLRHCKWFSNEIEARSHAVSIKKSGGKLLVFHRYERTEGEVPKSIGENPAED